MMTNTHSFVSWEEHTLCQERGSRVVHYYLKEASGELVLAVVGTERSIRHMVYVLSDEFVETYESKGFINVCTKWRARREVVEWLTSLVSRRCWSEFPDSPTDEATQPLPITGLGAHQTSLPDHTVPRKVKVHNLDIEWSGVAWICAKQLKHYPAFYKNETTISVHSFVFVMALEEEHHYLGYVEDMYEDKKGQKKVKVRWFHHTREVMDVITLNPHPREVFITPHVQVISAECVDGPATVLTPKHYEKCLAVVAQKSSSGIFMCFRQFEDCKVKPFSLAKLRGYSNQAILSSLDVHISKQKAKYHKFGYEDEEELAPDDPMRVSLKRNRSSEVNQGHSGVKNLVTGNHLPNCVPTYPKLKLKLSRKTMGVKIAGSEPLCPVSFKVDEKIELLCQDSGIRGCWFSCQVLQTSQKLLKVQYDDLQDVDGSGNLEEWVPAFKVAAPDKLGMRCSGRLTIRPCRLNDSTECCIEVGVAVDAWWCDGWWEGVVTGVSISGADTIQVYFPGEEKLMSFQRKDVRASKDWIENRWVDVKAKPDILSYVSENISSSMKLLSISASSVAKTCSKHEAVEEKQESPDLAPPDEDSGKVTRVNLRKQPCTSNEDEINNSSDGNGSDDCACNKTEKCEAPEATEVAARG
ncbi:hypothetical protein ACFX2I_037051 [Malus domestica]|uniref:uncharacterized protein n=1 Tax=Malus domestica TaxID=3750 RepID=UPI0010A9E8A8|nr:uncharacterized protein LOC103427780 [Malus domestica]XP_008364073.2 uncharacterized protein LOC103427780 [Malus domestica]